MRLPGSSRLRFSKQGTTDRIVLGFNLDSPSEGDFQSFPFPHVHPTMFTQP
jgi:hypothetical protein